MKRPAWAWWIVLVAVAMANFAGPRAAEAQDPATTPAAPRPVAPADLETPRGMAMGTGARASAISSSATAYNPASLPLGRLYHVEGLFGYEAAFGRWSVGGAVTDSVTNKLAAGASFRGILGGDDAGYTGFDGRLGLGMPLSDAVAIGLSGRYLSVGPGEQDATAPLPEAEGFTLDAAVRVSPVAGLHIAALGLNLIDMGSALAPIFVGGSAAYSVGEMFSFGGDVLVDMTTYERATILAGGGAEYLAGGTVPLRLGYRFDEGRQVHSVSGSVGYVDQQVGIDVALRQDVAGDDATQVLLGFRYHVQ